VQTRHGTMKFPAPDTSQELVLAR